MSSASKKSYGAISAVSATILHWQSCGGFGSTTLAGRWCALNAQYSVSDPSAPTSLLLTVNATNLDSSSHIGSFVGEAKRGLLRSERAHETREPAQSLVLHRVLRERPVHVVQVVIVAVRVVVAPLRVSVLVPLRHHRRPLRHEQRGEEVSHLAVAQRLRHRQRVFAILRGAETAVPGLIVVVPVVVVLPVRLVVLIVVRHQISQREPVVAGDEVDRVIRLSPVVIQRRGAAQALGEDARVPGHPADEIPRVVAEPTVPLRPLPPMRERANLVQPARVPRLRDELNVSQDGIFADHLDHRRLREVLPGDGVAPDARSRDAVAELRPVARRARQDGREVEPEAVDVRVPAAGVVVEVPVRGDHVVRPVVQTAERQVQTLLVAFRGVVEHDVQDDLDPGAVALSHERLELSPRGAAAVLARAFREQLLRREVVHGRVPPVVISHLARHRVRHGAVLELTLDDVLVRPAAILLREPAYGRLVHAHLVVVQLRRLHALPVEDIVRGRHRGGVLRPALLARGRGFGNHAVLGPVPREDRRRVRIQEHVLRVVHQPLVRVLRAPDAVAVQHLIGRLRERDMPRVPRAVELRVQRHLRRRRLPGPEVLRLPQAQVHRVHFRARVDREVYSVIGQQRRAHGNGHAVRGLPEHALDGFLHERRRR
eukprot:17180-Pelagococcus_subviridis.AAC.1